MRLIFEKRTLTAILIVAVLAAGIVWFFVLEGRGTPESQNEPSVFKQETIGLSVEGRPIEAYTYGNGTKHLVFVGGIHGGDERDNVGLAY